MKKIDRRVQRTQDALLQAMIELILEKGFTAMTVQEICERANIGRSTFYSHYADKEDLMQGSIEGLRTFLDASEPSEGNPDALAFCLPMLQHAEEHRDLFSALVGKRGGYLFQELIHDVWADLLRTKMHRDEVVIQAIAGAFGSTLTWWLSKEPGLSAEVVGARFLSAISPLLCESAEVSSEKSQLKRQ